MSEAVRRAGTPPVEPGDGPIAVGILGSCMTRDAFNRRFNPAYRTWYRVTAYQYMPSLISLMSEPTPIDDAELAGVEPYDADRIRDDFGKSVLATLAADPPAYLVIDLSGEIRVGVLQTGDHRWVTHANRLRRTPWYLTRRDAGALRPLSILRETDAYLRHWEDALHRLSCHLRARVPATTVILHRGQQSTRLVLPGTRELIDLATHRRVPRYDTAREIELWEHLDERALAVGGWRSIDLRDREYPTSDAHPWGARYLHYAPDRYPDFLAALHAIHLEQTGTAQGPEAASMAAFIADRALDTDRGRPWDDEPGRGDRPPRIRRPRAGRRSRRRRLRRLGRHVRQLLPGRRRRSPTARS